MTKSTARQGEKRQRPALLDEDEMFTRATRAYLRRMERQESFAAAMPLRERLRGRWQDRAAQHAGRAGLLLVPRRHQQVDPAPG